VNLLRIPYAYLYPAILVFCVLGVYAVNQSIVDVAIMTAMGALGYVLRKFDFEVAPIVLGLVLSPMLEMALRQSLALSAGDYTILFNRPIAATMLAFAAMLLLLSLLPLLRRGADWRRRMGLEE
jgi:putative tricarboxylic transport membrane protein